MLPGFRFLCAAIALSVSMLVFGLGAAALLRAAHQQFVSVPSMRAAPGPLFARQGEAPTATLSMLRVDASAAERSAQQASLTTPSREPAALPEIAPAPLETATPPAAPERAPAETATPATGQPAANDPAPSDPQKSEPAKPEPKRSETADPEPAVQAATAADPVATPGTDRTASAASEPAVARVDETQVATLVESPRPSEPAAIAPQPAPEVVPSSVAPSSGAATQPTRTASLGETAATVETQPSQKQIVRKRAQARRAAKRRRHAARPPIVRPAAARPANAAPFGG